MTRTTTLTRLQLDETLHIPLDAHTTLQVAAGTVVVRQPLRWLADTVLAPVATLRPGERCRIEQGGWVELRALGDGAAVRRLGPVPVWRIGWQVLWRQLKHVLPSGRKEVA